MINELKYVVDNSKYVSISYDKIPDFINLFDDLNYKHWSTDLKLNLSEKEWILLAFIIESMNFCFWKKPKWKIEYKNEILSGSNALFNSIIREVEENKDFLNINYLNNIDKNEFEKFFVSIEGKIPLIDERYNNFREVINFFNNNEKIYDELFQIKDDKLLLKYIINNLQSFDDKSVYKNRIIYFYKRATLLTNDLFYLSNTIRANIKNVNNLSGCADYGIPRTFRDYNILIYDKELANLVDNEKEILHDSEMEIEIRANMLYIIEIIKENLQRKGININSVELDNIIWLIGKKNKKTTAHHTITIYY